MMHQRFQFSSSSLLAVMLSMAFVLAAYERGEHLLGRGIGLMYALVAVLISVLFARLLPRHPRPKKQFMLLVLFTILVSSALAYPTSVNPNIQHFVNRETAIRNAREELDRLFTEEVAYRELGYSIPHRKMMNIQIYGSVPCESDLVRLRSTLLNQGRFVDQGAVHCHWRIHVLETSLTYIGSDDNELFAIKE